MTTMQQTDKKPSKSRIIFEFLRSQTEGFMFEYADLRKALKSAGEKQSGGAVSGCVWRLEHEYGYIKRVESNMYITLPALYKVDPATVFQKAAIKPWVKRNKKNADPIVMKGVCLEKGRSSTTESSVNNILAYVIAVQKGMQGLVDEVSRLQNLVQRDDLSGVSVNRLLKELAKRNFG